jgi:hypothetical protein
MKWTWTERRRDGFDHETVWGFVVLAMLLAARFVPFHRLGISTCYLYRFFHIPCSLCGGSRTWEMLAHAHWREGFSLNPLAVVLFILAIVYDLYAAVVVLGRRRRLRLVAFGKTDRRISIALVVLAILSNWIYVIHAFRSRGW